jgi:hypothetical protein
LEALKARNGAGDWKYRDCAAFSSISRLQRLRA